MAIAWLPPQSVLDQRSLIVPLDRRRRPGGWRLRIGTTEPPEDPGCCYGHSDATYSLRLACTAFFTESDCLLLTDEDGNFRCHWKPLDEYEARGGLDCEQWLMTTSAPTDPPGCCGGDSYKTNGECPMTQDKCEDNGCSWKLPTTQMSAR